MKNRLNIMVLFQKLPSWTPLHFKDRIGLIYCNNLAKVKLKTVTSNFDKSDEGVLKKIQKKDTDLGI